MPTGINPTPPPDAPVHSWRQVSLYRVAMLVLGGVLLAVGAAVTYSVPTVVAWLALVVLAVGFTLVQRAARGRAAALLIVLEGLAAALIIMASQSAPDALILYLVVPAVWAGSVLRPRTAILAGSTGSWLLFAWTAAGGGSAAVPAVVLLGLPVVVSLASVWLTRIESQRHGPEYEYDRALTLLRQLAPITRRLPLGLERTTLLHQSAHDIAALQPSADLTIYAFSDGVWTVEVGAGAEEPSMRPGGSAWNRAIKRGRPRVERAGRNGSGASALVPMRRGKSIVGMLGLVKTSGWFSRRDLAALQRSADTLALQIEASDVFSRIREDATREERSRLSRQIHDGVAQDLAGLAYVLDSMAADPEEEDHGSAAGAAADEVRRLVEELRYSIFDLRTEVAEDTSLGTALASYVRQVGDQSGLRVSVEIDDRSGSVGPGASAELMRIAQEAITNARRHSHATTLSVSLRVTRDGVVLRITDNGIGIDRPRGTAPAGGHGLGIMRERAERIGAEVRHIPRSGGGTTVECRLYQAQATPRAAAAADNTAPGAWGDASLPTQPPLALGAAS